MANGTMVKVFGWYDNEWGYSLPARRPRSGKLAGCSDDEAAALGSRRGRRRQGRARPGRPERAARGRPRRGRHADPGGAADAASCCSSEARRAIRVCSHLGRPKGEDPAFPIEPVRAHLRELLPDERIEVLENTRFDPGETANDPGLRARARRRLRPLRQRRVRLRPPRARLDRGRRAPAAGVRGPAAARASSRRSARLLGEVERPFVLVVGGAKVEDKLGVLENLGGRADTVLIGGKMAEELRDENPLDVRRSCCRSTSSRRRRSPRTPRRGSCRTTTSRRLARPRHRPRDAGGVRAPQIRGAKTVFWNGPMGVFEWPRFAEGTKAVAQAVADVRRLHGRRRRRLGAGGQRARARRPDLVGLDRRRRLARAARGQGAARAWRRSRRHDVLIAGNWKMFKGPARDARRSSTRFEAPDGRRRRRLPAVRVARGRRRRAAGRVVRAERPLGAERRLHGRDLARDAARARRLRRDRRPLRAAAVLRRDRRDGRAPRARGARARASA